MKKALFKLAATGQQVTFCQFSYVLFFFSLKFVILGKKMGEQEQRERRKVRVRARGGLGGRR